MNSQIFIPKTAILLLQSVDIDDKFTLRLCIFGHLFKNKIFVTNLNLQRYNKALLLIMTLQTSRGSHSECNKQCLKIFRPYRNDALEKNNFF